MRLTNEQRINSINVLLLSPIRPDLLNLKNNTRSTLKQAHVM